MDNGGNILCLHFAMRLTNESGYRTYRTPLGHLPSVTTIISATESEKSKQSLGAWKAKNPGNEAADRGTAVHSWVEHTLKKENPEYPSGLEQWCEPLQLPLQQFGRMIWIEGPVENGHMHTVGEDGHARVWSSSGEQGYAGCPDLIGERFGGITLGDLKTSTSWYHRRPPAWNTLETDPDFWLKYGGYNYKFSKCAMQLVAYKQAVKETLGLEVKQLMILVSNPGAKCPTDVKNHSGAQVITLTDKEVATAEKQWAKRLAAFKKLQEEVAA